MKSLKICFTTNSSPWTKFHGGGQIFVHNLAQALSNFGHQVTVIYTGPGFPSTDTIKYDYRTEWAPYIGYPYTAAFRQLNSYTVYKKLKDLYTRHKFDLINAVGEEALFLPKFCRDTGATLFFSIEHPQLSSIKPTFKFSKLFFLLLAVVRTRDLLINRSACRHAKAVITPSQFTKAEAIKYFKISPSKIRIINHGIIEEMFLDDLAPNMRDKNGPLLYFGRLEPQKGVDLLIIAYHKLLKENIISKQELIILGSGPDENNYRSLVTQLGLRDKVHFKGWQSAQSIRAYMAKASLCILPSRSESFGLSMAETLAQNLPLVTTSAGSIPEVVDSGRGGWLAKPNDHESLYKTMFYAITYYDESLKKAEYGRNYSRHNFTWQKAAHEYEQLYLEYLNR
jgi:glycosyltransferase involved in cell wall biosynthesis